MYTGVQKCQESGYTSRGASHFHQSKHCLDVDEVPLFVSYKFRQKSIVEMNQCSCYEYKPFQKKQSNEGVLVSLPFYKLENVTER